MKKNNIAIICLTILAILLCWTLIVPIMCVIEIGDLAESKV